MFNIEIKMEVDILMNGIFLYLEFLRWRNFGVHESMNEGVMLRWQCENQRQPQNLEET